MPVPPPTVMATVVSDVRVAEPDGKLAVTVMFCSVAPSFTVLGLINSSIWVGAVSSSVTSTVVPATV